MSAASLESMGLLLLPLLGIGENRRRKALARSVIIGIVTIGALTGCGDTKDTYEIPTGTVQVLVSATVAGITRTSAVRGGISAGHKEIPRLWTLARDLWRAAYALGG